MNDNVVTGFMREAIREGRKALPTCIPNPPVGCVIVQNGCVVARGHTNELGEDHAEAMALKSLASNLDGCTAFVTLEPCSFHGRTPSCAEALATSGIARVYVSTLDPDPRNNGKGIEFLRSKGIVVTVGILEKEALMELSPYLIRDTVA